MDTIHDCGVGMMYACMKSIISSVVKPSTTRKTTVAFKFFMGNTLFRIKSDLFVKFNYLIHFWPQQAILEVPGGARG